MDFKNSLVVGLEAAKKARSNKDEIFSVINDLSDSIKEVTQGRVSLKVTSERRLSHDYGGFASVAAMAFTTLKNINPYVEYEALSLITQRDEAEVTEKVAEWKMNESDGYPCVISYNKRDVSCKNKDMLIKALSDLMSDASTGDVILRMINA